MDEKEAERQADILISVLVDTPAHSRVTGPLSYLADRPLAAGTLVRVPLGTRELLGVVWDDAPAHSVCDPTRLRPIAAVLDLPPLGRHWRTLIDFAARYYQRSAGEVALAALPPQLRDLSVTQLGRRWNKPLPAKSKNSAASADEGTQSPDRVALSAEQTGVIAQFHAQKGPFLLFGATGSGKTEVFMRCTADLLAQSPDAQVLVMVPEINLTPQLEDRFKERFCQCDGRVAVVSMHSGMTPAQRLKSWLAAHSGTARIVLGTRMAVFASMPRLQLIIVDEEHDPSYKSHEGARYSARDLAVYRGRLEDARVMLGSATPSLESWHHSRPAEGGRYVRLWMPSRIGTHAVLPQVRRVDMNHQPRHCVISPPLLDAILQRIARGEQSLIFLNRRGYAPVLHCADCGWKSECTCCSAYRVFHKVDRSLRCHHCGATAPVPRACPACGNPDIVPIGKGTERLEELLADLLAAVTRPDGQPVRIVRIDADSTRHKGELEARLTQVHSGQADVLVGTQMIAKGHDFRRITLVAAVNPDNALFSSDFRAPERLFGLLMQAAGRAGRDADLAGHSEMWVQTFCPMHPLFGALMRYDYPAFAQSQLAERKMATMPPFGFQALVRAEARTQEAAQFFLNHASAAAHTLPDAPQQLARITLYPAVPMSIQRIQHVERAQMLVESTSRTALQQFLAAWQAVLHQSRSHPQCKGLIRWAIDVDPLLI